MGTVRRLLIPAALLVLALPGAGAGDVILNDRDLRRLQDGVRTADLSLPAEDRSLPVVSPAATGEAAERLRALEAEGVAQGFAGILYDNRDRGHSRLDPALFPRLPHLSYGFELIADGADYGLAGGTLLPAAVFGNSSTAITHGPAPRSLPRFAMTTPEWPRVQARLYESNHLYVYPEHRDHDAEDRFPANWPYMVVSQGSSGSDLPFLEAIAMTLAAFPPETFALMRDRGLVAPTLQAILRQSLAPVTARGDYLSGVAHPVVFDASLLRPERMVAAAAGMQPGDIPPLVRLSVEAEDFAPAAGLAGLDERLFDSPSAIARIWRGPAWERQMTLAASAADPERRPVSFEWRVLQGLEDKVEITPLDPDGRRARLTVRWHDAFAIEGPEARRQTARVDIGVFASTGGTDSAPAILSISFPTHEARSYGPLPGGGIGLLSVDYDAINRWAYYDPILHWSAPWTDAPLRDAGGAIAGWTRTGRDGTVTTVGQELTYRIDRDRPDQPVLVEGGRAP
jgi:hypothetical protein